MSEPSMRRILGIDPGTNILGFAVIEAQGRKQARLITLDVLKLPGRLAIRQIKANL